jgi:hypothetical protein
VTCCVSAKSVCSSPVSRSHVPHRSRAPCKPPCAWSSASAPPEEACVTPSLTFLGRPSMRSLASLSARLGSVHTTLMVTIRALLGTSLITTSNFTSRQVPPPPCRHRPRLASRQSWRRRGAPACGRRGYGLPRVSAQRWCP